jgi:hypothetical protein
MFLLIIKIGTVLGCINGNWDCYLNKIANQPAQHVHVDQSVYMNMEGG